jgi:mannose-6-phosphate isomerase-like protein (cupin superfamily)
MISTQTPAQPTSQPIVQSGPDFAVAHMGAFADLDQFTFTATVDDRPVTASGKLFLKDLLALTGAELSLNSLPPKQSLAFYHKHQQNEEIYIFLTGAGEFQVNDWVFPVQEGTVVRVDPQGERCLRNRSSSDRLCWIVVQVRAQSYAEGATIEDGIVVPKRVSWVGKRSLSTESSSAVSSDS